MMKRLLSLIVLICILSIGFIVSNAEEMDWFQTSSSRALLTVMLNFDLISESLYKGDELFAGMLTNSSYVGISDQQVLVVAGYS